MTEEEMVGWHYWVSEHESEQAPGDGNGQGSLACCSPWGCNESDTTEWLNNNMGLRVYLVAQEGKESTCTAGDQGLIPRSEDPLENWMATHFGFVLFCLEFHD